MSLWQIAWGYLWNRKVPTILTILSVALGVGLISAVHTLRNETEKRFAEEGQAFDIVVGAKGSPLQLVLSSVYFMDQPTGNIAYSDFEAIRDHEDVAAAFPIGLGDTYHGLRIVGTTPDLFDHEWVLNAEGTKTRRPFKLKDGQYFDGPMQAVVGSIAAEQTGLKLGDTFHGTHGFSGAGHTHKEHPYTVVGMLEPGGTPNDRAIFVSLDSVWQVHGHTEHGEHEAGEVHAEHGEHDHDHEAHAGEAHEEAEHDDAEHEEEEALEVTAVLVSLHSPGLRFTFLEDINMNTKVMAAIPVMQIKKLYSFIVAPAKSILLAVAYLVVVGSALTIMIGLYLAILQRRRDLAVMRALGASPLDIFGAVILEAFWVTILGVAVGWLLGNLVSWSFGLYLTQKFGMTINAFGLSTDEMKSFAVVLLVGYLAGIMPAWQAYQTDIARDLARQ